MKKPFTKSVKQRVGRLSEQIDLDFKNQQQKLIEADIEKQKIENREESFAWADDIGERLTQWR